jgi:flagellar biosynthesis protein FliQ
MMGLEEILGSASEALILIVQIALPTLLISAALGFLVTIFQTVTRINESTIQQDLKIFVTLAVVFATGPAMLAILSDYMMRIFDRINAMAPPP